MRRLPSIQIFIFAILALFILTACRASTVKIGWACVNGINKLHCNYRMFSGREIDEMCLATGEHLTVDFDVKVVSGVLFIKIQDSNGDPI